MFQADGQSLLWWSVCSLPKSNVLQPGVLLRAYRTRYFLIEDSSSCYPLVYAQYDLLFKLSFPLDRVKAAVSSSDLKHLSWVRVALIHRSSYNCFSWSCDNCFSGL
uniref:Uncharacterized protein orf105e n=1 Tax=Beta vulgaris subsp. maritima TaxID=350892 RepID=E8ZC33_BETVM|nr:hypothetical protein [Beta vulgaris subsp. maritima]CBL52022.1 hypothetical protein [Beta vulgaris subsp. maritima]